MTATRYLDFVDTRQFRTLFIDELGWDNPDQADLHLTVDDEPFTLTQVAGYKGLRIWHCAALPGRRIQRALDVLVGKDNHERLIIFSNDTRQEWRWPRRAQLGSTNAKLLAHEHVVGDRNTHLTQRLHAIELDFDENLSLVALLERMRDAFDVEAETASVQAARLMGTLYTELEATNATERDATLLLARLLFLLFGDDADMWGADLFHHFIRDHTTPSTLHTDLQTLFEVLDTPENDRKLEVGDPYSQFRYINGGLFADTLLVRALTPAFRGALLEACEFDWAIISPAVFGSMFQTVKSKEARRHGGEHYTTEENILKTIRPLFLDEYTERLQTAWDDKAQLTKLQNELGRLRFLDPACGCGNFLIVAYRELRALELDILKRRRDLDLIDNTHIRTAGIDRSQLSLDVTGDIKVTLDHFYGIEIDEWPARIAETAMLLVDHLANQRMTQEFGNSPDRLPIKISSKIAQGNALRINWGNLLPATRNVIIFGNPPFIGHKQRSASQTADLKRVWGNTYTGFMDYVTAWHKTAVDYFGQEEGRWAFVSTSSVTQGDPVTKTWQPILDAGWRISFAHRPFIWTSEAMDGAGVHVVVIGMAKSRTSQKARLFNYASSGKGPAAELLCDEINPYLTAGPCLLVKSRTTPLQPELPRAFTGSQLSDDGGLVITREELADFEADPVAARYIRELVGARTLLYGEKRWCLWLKEAPAEDIRRSGSLRTRINRVREFRENSPKPDTFKKAATPHLFADVRQPDGAYLAIPKTSGESRRYLPTARFSGTTYPNNTVFTASDPDGFLFSVISSGMFAAWQRAIGGRTRADLNFSTNLVWNNFPVPHVGSEIRKQIIDSGLELIEIRKKYPDRSLAALYDLHGMPTDLLSAHLRLDALVDGAFGAKKTLVSEVERQALLFRRYEELARAGTLSATSKRQRR